MNFVLLNDPAGQKQQLIRADHISAIQVSKADRLITLLLLGGQELHLTHEESKQFRHWTRRTCRPAPTCRSSRAGMLLAGDEVERIIAQVVRLRGSSLSARGRAAILFSLASRPS